MKRRKKQPGTPGQLCLFDMPVTRQEEESGRKTKIKPVKALKSSGLTLVPPAPVKVFKTPQNVLKMEIPTREELNRLWKEDPEALHVLNRMKDVNPCIIDLVRAFNLVPQKKIK